MAKCRITNLKPPCDYSVDGIAKVWLLDFDDFAGFRFFGNDLYSNCLVTDILRTGDFTEISAPDMVAKYTGNGQYLHALETFVGSLEAAIVSALHLGTKRRQLVVFRGNNGKYFTFGYEAGAALTYQSQTAEGFGALVNIATPSRFPLFEVTAEAMTRFTTPSVFTPDFENGAYCETT